MEISFLYDKSRQPGEKELSTALGSSFQFWQDFRQYINNSCTPVTEDWKMYSSKSGWTMKLLYKKRNLLFFSPNDGCFYITYIFGEKAVKKVESSKIPEEIKQTLREAKPYAEGRGIRLEVRDAGMIEPLKILFDIKLLS